MTQKITIIGGGLAGSLAAIYMAKRGFEVTLFERRPDMRKTNVYQGRSINLALSTRGLHALEKIGLDKEILADAIPMTGRMMHSKTGELSYHAYGKNGQAINSVSRGRLNQKLIELADEFPNINIYFNSRCIDVDVDKATATFELEDGSKKTIQSDRILGTDGAFAATRGKMQITDRFNYSQQYLHVGYKELSIPAGENGAFLMEKNALHIWPRGSFMMIALPNPAGDFTCTLFFPYEIFDRLKTDDEILNFFNQEFADAVPMMPTLLEDFKQNPVGNLVTVKCYPWVKEDKIALMGDAAHAIVPFYGQGMNCSFEDVVVFDQMIEKYGNDWNTIFEEYQKERKPNADAIADLAVQNYYEMADKVGDKHFLHKKHLEHDLSELYPDKFKSQYELTTFSLSGYKYALDQGKKNDVLLEKIIAEGAEEKIKDTTYMDRLWHLLQ
ncbi:MAG: FAD-dependent monooxygenase [Bacteroidetes bacterium]|nr:MAG: FAD-dependent monooxygenase [Bacteroidota bacterium]